MTEVTSEIVVRMRHVRAAGICPSGTKAFFVKHGLDFRAFVRDGIAASTLEEINDPIANRALEEAVKEAASGR